MSPLGFVGVLWQVGAIRDLQSATFPEAEALGLKSEEPVLPSIPAAMSSAALSTPLVTPQACSTPSVLCSCVCSVTKAGGWD